MIACLQGALLAFVGDSRIVYRCDECGREAAAPPGFYPQGWTQGIGCFDWCLKCSKKLRRGLWGSMR